MKQSWAVTKRNLINGLVPFIITLICIVASSSSGEPNFDISRGNYSYLYILMLPFFIVFGNFKKFMNLNASKKAYYHGSILSYLIGAFGISALNTLIYLTIDSMSKKQAVYNLMGIFGWLENGVFAAFIQQFCFLFVLSLFLHVLLSMQDRWYGWLADIIIAAVISVFTPIASLREILVSFLKLVVINETFWLHIIICTAIALMLYFTGLAVIKRKTI